VHSPGGARVYFERCVYLQSHTRLYQIEPVPMLIDGSIDLPRSDLSFVYKELATSCRSCR
jgi:hypothetical protein